MRNLKMPPGSSSVIYQVAVETGVTGRGSVTLSSILIGVKPLIYRDWERKLLVRQPQTTQFCLAVKRLNCTFAFFCLPAVWYYWWSPVPRNEVEGVITQSDGYDSNHQEVCKKIYVWLWIVFSGKQRPFVPSSSLIICLSIYVFVFLSFAHCVQTCIMCALLSMLFTPWGVLLGRHCWHKPCVQNSAQGQHLTRAYNAWTHRCIRDNDEAQFACHVVAQSKHMRMQVCTCRHCCFREGQRIDPSISVNACGWSCFPIWKK